MTAVSMKGEVPAMNTGVAGEEAGQMSDLVTEVTDVMQMAEEAVLDHVSEGSEQAATSALALAHELMDNCPEGKFEMTLPGAKITCQVNGTRIVSYTVGGMKMTFELETSAK